MHIKSLDGLRGIAALIVCLFHYSGNTGALSMRPDWGALGVMIFFTLSGFLMGHLHFGQTPTRAGIKRFLQRRAARVLPLYFLLVIISAAFILTVPELWPYKVKLKNLPSHLLLIQGKNVLWTIPIEVHFYLLFPLFWFVRHRLGNQAVWLFLGLLALCFLLPPRSHHWITGTMHLFIAGLVVSCLPARAGRAWNAAFIASLVALIVLLPSVSGVFGHIPADEVNPMMWANPLYPLATGAAVACAIRAPLAHALLGSAPLRFLGSISYSLYLMHSIVIFGFVRFLNIDPGLTVFLAVTIAVSYASYRLIEQPAQRYFSQTGSVGHRTVVA